MNDPHVVALHYRVQVSEGYSFANPPPLDVRRLEFDGTLHNDAFVARMSEHYPMEREAKIPVDAFLRAWEITTGLSRQHTVMRFVFDHAEIIDRMPSKPGEVRVYASTMLEDASLFATASAHLEMGLYPPAPVDFVADLTVETLWGRYERYRADKDSLYSMAYYCLTVLERRGGRRNAANRFQIDFKVIDHLARLSSEKGDAMEARKATAVPATSSEKAWLNAAILAIIRQVGTVSAGKKPAQLHKSDLPQLE